FPVGTFKPQKTFCKAFLRIHCAGLGAAPKRPFSVAAEESFVNKRFPRTPSKKLDPVGCV
ncbi:MAG: hypothetical protein IJW40_01655, partial [Clostridia bacterium]|nr:hypothetical protein [Clostridia bacterium]